MSVYDHKPQPMSGGDLVRPYLATAGRTTSRVEGLKFETQVQATSAPSTVRFESAKVLAMCDHPISIAEIAVRLGMPFGSVKVVVGDLIMAGNLKAHQEAAVSDSADVQLISRLISGVKDL